MPCPQRPRTDRLIRCVRMLATGLPLLLAMACASADPSKELKVSDLETYWVIQSTVGDTTYISPAVRFRVANVGTRSWRAIYISAAFRLGGHKEEWGSGWARVPVPGKLFAPGEQALVVMAAQEARYHSTGPAERMFQHPKFEDAQVEVYAQMAGSKQTKLIEARIERRIGARSVQEYLR
jgi:hypothetical protein